MKRTPSMVASVIVLTLVLPASRVAAQAVTPTKARSARKASISAAARSHVYYVATNGNDAHAGTSAHPFRSIQHDFRDTVFDREFEVLAHRVSCDN